MIVRMKKSTVICLLSEKEQALKLLRELGVMHVEAIEMRDSEDRMAMEKHLVDAVSALNILTSVKISDAEEMENAACSLSGDDLCLRILELDRKKNEIARERQRLEREKTLLEPWGDFPPEMISSMKDNGVYVYLCSASHDEFSSLPANIEYRVISEDRYRVYFAVISNIPVDETLLPTADVPLGGSLSGITGKIVECDRTLVAMNEDLIKLVPGKKVLKNHIRNIREQIEFAYNRDGMMESGTLACISGYCPVPEVQNLQKSARDHGWGLRLTDPTDDDRPPTLITIPRIFECANALLNFIGISPGYREWDTSVCFLFFFTLFFSMIIGDAGYGIIFLIAAIFAKRKFGNNLKLRLYLNLFVLLSCATIVWGFINGTFFAIPSGHLPSWMQGFDWFTDTKLKEKHLQLLCFFIAATHLSLARFWQASLVWNSTKALAQIGWALILWGNFFVARKLIVYPESPWPLTVMGLLFGFGLFFVIVFGVNWRKMDEAFGFLFGMSGTFVDLLSYIRLFAVGLSSYYIAKSFNDMGMMVLGSSSRTAAIPFLVIGMIIVILFGHILNVMLGFLGVLVHGIRLNTLEFSNHMGLQWLGHIYRPFRRDVDE